MSAPEAASSGSPPAQGPTPAAQGPTPPAQGPTPATQPPTAEQRRRLARRMRLVNIPMRLLLALPFRTPLSSRLMLLHYKGRRTGRNYRQPVSYVRDGSVLLTPGGGKWKSNLKDGQPIRVHFQGRWVEARPELVTDSNEVTQLLGRMQAANPNVAKYMPAVRRDGSVDRDVLEAAIAHGFCVVRWRLDAP